MANNKIEDIPGMIPLGDKFAFPIHWLNNHAYCEWKLYLEHIKGVEVEPTPEMIEGKQEHERLYSEFVKEAVPATLPAILAEAKTTPVTSREVLVKSEKHGVVGRIDEILFTPDAIVVIDDKPGTRAYNSDINQVLGYCLAFKEIVETLDQRPIVAALRERGTDNIHWRLPFDGSAERSIMEVIDRVHGLMSGQEEFTSNKNPNKCKPCSLRQVCDRSVV